MRRRMSERHMCNFTLTLNLSWKVRLVYSTKKRLVSRNILMDHECRLEKAAVFWFYTWWSHPVPVVHCIQRSKQESSQVQNVSYCLLHQQGHFQGCACLVLSRSGNVQYQKFRIIAEKCDHEVEAALQVVLPHFDLIFVTSSSSSPNMRSLLSASWEDEPWEETARRPTKPGAFFTFLLRSLFVLTKVKAPALQSLQQAHITTWVHDEILTSQLQTW